VFDRTLGTRPLELVRKRYRAREGQFDLALRLARAISKLDKIPRSGGLIQIAHATGNAALFDEVLAAIFDGEPITMGTGRGYDELAAGVRTIDALSVLPEAHPVLKKLCAHIVRLGKQGQRQSKPTAFAKALADAGRRAAALTGRGSEGWLGHAEEIRAAISLDEEALSVDDAITAAKTRLERGESAKTPASEAAHAQVDDDDQWGAPSIRRRVNAASRLAVNTIQARDVDALFELLTDALGLTVGSYTETLARWQSQSSETRAALLPEILALEPTPEKTWCAHAPEAFWTSLAELTDSEQISSVLRVLRERDFFTRAYPSPSWRQPRAIAAIAIDLAQRINASMTTLAGRSRPQPRARQLQDPHRNSDESAGRACRDAAPGHRGRSLSRFGCERFDRLTNDLEVPHDGVLDHLGRKEAVPTRGCIFLHGEKGVPYVLEVRDLARRVHAVSGSASARMRSRR
jgi:hypothetical protein